MEGYIEDLQPEIYEPDHDSPLGDWDRNHPANVVISTGRESPAEGGATICNDLRQKQLDRVKRALEAGKDADFKDLEARERAINAC